MIRPEGEDRWDPNAGVEWEDEGSDVSSLHLDSSDDATQFGSASIAGPDVVRPSPVRASVSRGTVATSPSRAHSARLSHRSIHDAGVDRLVLERPSTPDRGGAAAPVLAWSSSRHGSTSTTDLTGGDPDFSMHLNTAQREGDADFEDTEARELKKLKQTIHRPHTPPYRDPDAENPYDVLDEGEEFFQWHKDHPRGRKATPVVPGAPGRRGVGRAKTGLRSRLREVRRAARAAAATAVVKEEEEGGEEETKVRAEDIVERDSKDDDEERAESVAVSRARPYQVTEAKRPSRIPPSDPGGRFPIRQRRPPVDSSAAAKQLAALPRKYGTPRGVRPEEDLAGTTLVFSPRAGMMRRVPKEHPTPSREQPAQDALFSTRGDDSRSHLSMRSTEDGKGVVVEGASESKDGTVRAAQAVIREDGPVTSMRAVAVEGKEGDSVSVASVAMERLDLRARPQQRTRLPRVRGSTVRSYPATPARDPLFLPSSAGESYDDGAGYYFHMARASRLPWIAANGLRPMVLGIDAGTHHGHDFRPSIFAHHCRTASDQKELEDELGDTMVALRFEPEGDFVRDPSATVFDRLRWITDDGFIDPSHLVREGMGPIGAPFAAPPIPDGHTFVARVPPGVDRGDNVLPMVEVALAKRFRAPATAKYFHDSDALTLRDLPAILMPTFVDFKASSGWGESMSDDERDELLSSLGAEFGWNDDEGLNVRRKEYPAVRVYESSGVLYVAPLPSIRHASKRVLEDADWYDDSAKRFR